MLHKNNYLHNFELLLADLEDILLFEVVQALSRGGIARNLHPQIILVMDLVLLGRTNQKDIFVKVSY